VSKCQSRINAASKEQLYSITSSARASSVGGTCGVVKPDNFQAALAVFSSTFSTMTAVS